MLPRSVGTHEGQEELVDVAGGVHEVKWPERPLPTQTPTTSGDKRYDVTVVQFGDGRDLQAGRVGHSSFLLDDMKFPPLMSWHAGSKNRSISTCPEGDDVRWNIYSRGF